jgi:class 3 adenylate cyclase/tetratricopeptide (TPR) repeat protein
MAPNLIPRIIHDQYRQGRMSGHFEAASFFLDIAGFTPLTDRLMAEGKEGAEILSGLVNGIFRPVIDAVYNYGGFITGFAGDAFTAVFPESSDGQAPGAASLAIIELFRKQGRVRTRRGQFELSAKIGLSSGSVVWGIAGKPDHKTYYFMGPAIDGCARAEHECEAMEILLDPAFQASFDLTIFEVKKRPEGYCRLSGLKSQPPPSASTEEELEDGIVRQFVPGAVLDNPQPGEFRNVASVFVGFRVPGDALAIERLAVTIIERSDAAACYSEGLDFGDKGCTTLFLFGVPTVYERELERAAEFALGLKREFGDRLRAGITFGTVFAGIKGGVRRSSYGVLGDTVNMSARMMMKAEWGDVWIADNVAERLKNRYDLEAIGPQVVKGRSQPLTVSKLLRVKPAGREKLYSGVMIGREKDLSILNERAAALAEKKFCGITYLYGDAGMGKSRLAYEFCESLKARVETRYLPCDNILRKSMNPFVSFFGDYFQTVLFRDDEGRKSHFEEIFADLVRQVGDGGTPERSAIRDELIRTRSIIGGLIGLRWPGSLYEELEPQARFENSLYAIKNFFQALSILRPTIIVLDDMQWLDADSRRAFEVLARKIDPFPIMIIAAGRFHDDGSRPTLAVDPGISIREITLESFDAETIAEYIASQLDGRPDPQLVDFIADKSQGNPFFIEQFCLYLRENNLIRRDGDRINLTGRGSDLPAGIHAVITARIDRLSRELREIVQLASVLGNEFESRVLRTLISLYRSAIGEGEFESLLVQGENEKIWSAISELKYLFKNALVQEVAYEMQLRQHLRQLHQLAGAAIEKHYPDDKSHYEDLVYHYEQAESRERMIVYLEKAGDYTREKYENEKAINFYEKLIAVVPDPTHRIEIQNRKAGILGLIGRWAEAEDIYRVNIAAGGNKLLVAQNRTDLAELLINKGEYEPAWALVEEARTVYTARDDRRGICTITRLQGVIRQNQGDSEAAMAYYREARKIAEEFADRHEVSYIISNIGAVYWSIGDYEKARDHFLEYLTIAEELHDKKGMGMAMLNLGVAYRNLGDDQKAEEFYRRKLEISQELGDKRGLGIVIGNMGALHQSRGEYDQAVDCYHRRIAIAEEIGDRRGVGTSLGNLASLYKDLGDYDRALEASDQAIQIMRTLGVKYYLCTFLDTQADLFLNLGKIEDARVRNREALAIAEEIKYSEIVFNSRVKQAKIAALDDRSRAIKALEGLVETYKDDENQAILYYELFKLTADPRHKDRSAELYRKLLSVQFEIDHQKHLDELVGKGMRSNDET